MPAGSEATTPAWLFVLQKTPETRKSLALVNVGPAGESADVFRVDLFDGSTGRKAVSARGMSVPAPSLLRDDGVLARQAPGVVSRYGPVTPTSGANPFMACPLVNDGREPGLWSCDGAFVAATFRR